MKKKTAGKRISKKIADETTHPKKQTQGDLAYHSIKDKILFCDLAPGEELSEAQLVSRFNMGKASVRSALTRLVQEGLVRVVPRSGYIITPLTIRDIHEVFEFRTILEVAAVRKAAGHVETDRIRQLDKVCRVGYDPDDRKSISNNQVNVIYEDKTGSLWIGTYDGGLNRFDRKTNMFTNYRYLIFL